MSGCNSVECKSVELTYYQRNRGVILNSAKDYYENDKGRLRDQAGDKYRNLSEEEKIKIENMEKTDTTICAQKKKTKTKRISKELSRGKKSLIIIMNKIVF